MEWMKMYHPETGATAKVARSAFERVHVQAGWVDAAGGEAPTEVVEKQLQLDQAGNVVDGDGNIVTEHSAPVLDEDESEEEDDFEPEEE